jgi:hypothetical protein
VNLLAAIAALALGQAQTTWSAEVRVGARARSPQGNDGNTPVAADVELSPRLGGALSGAGWSLGLDYSAFFRARQPHISFRPEHTHVASLNLGWRRDGRARPFVFVTGNYGVVDLTNLTAPQATPVQSATEPTYDPTDPFATPPEAPSNPSSVPVDAIPTLESLLAYGVDATLGVEVPLSPLVGWTTAAGFFHGGGADAPSRLRMPVQNAPRLSSRVEVQVTRLDAIGLLADARMAWFQTLDEAGQAELSLAYRRQLAPTTTLELRAGAAGTMNKAAPSADPEAPAPQRTFNLLPSGSLAFNHRFDLRTFWGLSLWASAGAGPWLDRFRAIAYERVDWQGGFTANLYDVTSLRFGGGASVALGAEQQIGTLVTSWLEGTLSVHPQRWWRADLTAARSVVTTNLLLADGSQTPPVVQWVIGLGLTVVGSGQL